MKVLLQGIGMLFLSLVLFYAVPAFSQTQDSGALDNHKFLYGIHAGFTINTVNLYHVQNGVVHALDKDKHSICAPAFSIATIGEVRLSHNYSLRVMPGVSIFNSTWEPTDSSLPASLPSYKYKMEVVSGELPVEVNFRTRIGKLEPYISTGLCYRFDLTSKASVQPLNAHDLHFLFGYGVDWYTRYVKVGFMFRAGYGLFSPGTDGSGLANPLYYHNTGSTLAIGLNIEA